MIYAILFVLVALASYCIGRAQREPDIHHFTMRMGGPE